MTAGRLRNFTAKLGALQLNPTDAAMAKAAVWLGTMGSPRAGEITTKTSGHSTKRCCPPRPSCLDGLASDIWVVGGDVEVIRPR